MSVVRSSDPIANPQGDSSVVRVQHGNRNTEQSATATGTVARSVAPHNFVRNVRALKIVELGQQPLDQNRTEVDSPRRCNVAASGNDSAAYVKVLDSS